MALEGDGLARGVLDRAGAAAACCLADNPDLRAALEDAADWPVCCGFRDGMEVAGVRVLVLAGAFGALTGVLGGAGTAGVTGVFAGTAGVLLAATGAGLVV